MHSVRDMALRFCVICIVMMSIFCAGFKTDPWL